MTEHYSFDAENTEQVTRVLTMLVACAGNQPKARKLLSNDGVEISGPDLAKLRTDAGDEYDRLAEAYGPKLEAQIVRDVREIASRATAVQLAAIERAEATVGELKPAEAAKAARDLAHVSGQNVEQVLKLTGRPTQITEDRSVKQIAQALVARKLLVPVGQAPVIEGTAEEITDDPDGS